MIGMIGVSPSAQRVPSESPGEGATREVEPPVRPRDAHSRRIAPDRNASRRSWQGVGRAGLAGVLACTAAGDAQPSHWLGRCLQRPPAHRWELPPAFREVSGLALAPDGRLFLHNDERGVLAAVDVATGRLVGTYTLGPATPRDDFEGITVAGDRIYLLNSRGHLYEVALPPAGAAQVAGLAYRRFSTGLEEQCEFEGLAEEAGDDVLLMACKTPYVKALEQQLTIFRWSRSAGALAQPDRLSVPLDSLVRGRRSKGFAASGIERDAASGHLLLVAGPDRAIAELDARGRVLGAYDLGRGHRQAEGIAITQNGLLLVADEGRRGRGTITGYACGER